MINYWLLLALSYYTRPHLLNTLSLHHLDLHLHLLMHCVPFHHMFLCKVLHLGLLFHYLLLLHMLQILHYNYLPLHLLLLLLPFLLLFQILLLLCFHLYLQMQCLNYLKKHLNFLYYYLLLSLCYWDMLLFH